MALPDLYTIDTAQAYPIGARYEDKVDGRVFRYAKTGDAVKSYHGVAASEEAALAYTAPAASQIVGDLEVTATLAGREADDLEGGYIMIYDPSDIDNSQNRRIVGNDATDDGKVRIDLDAGLTHVVTINQGGLEIFENPYQLVKHGAHNHRSVVGVPAISAAITKFIWIQTWGPCVVSPGEDIDDPAADARELVFGPNHVLFLRASKPYAQLAGFYLNPDSGNIAGPLIMLMISR